MQVRDDPHHGNSAINGLSFTPEGGQSQPSCTSSHTGEEPLCSYPLLGQSPLPCTAAAGMASGMLHLPMPESQYLPPGPATSSSFMPSSCPQAALGYWNPLPYSGPAISLAPLPGPAGAAALQGEAREALPPEGWEGGRSGEDGDTVYVNVRQHHAIMRRRRQRAKAEAENKVLRERKHYLHESRHEHAVKRVRGPGGRFLTAAEKEAAAAADSKAELGAVEGNAAEGSSR